MSNLKNKTYYVKGMHCSSCELLIEKRLLEIDNVKFADASVGKANVVIEYEGQAVSAEQLNKIFKKDGYVFTEEPVSAGSVQKKSFYKIVGIAVIIIAIFYLLNRSGLSALVNVSSGSSFITFFFFGIMAGVSSCAALVGGIILSMSKQWSETHNKEDATLKKMQPNFMFNIGRLISYGLLGALLGLIGKSFSFSPIFSSGLVIVVSLIMIFLGFCRLKTPRLITSSLGTSFQGMDERITKRNLISISH